MEKNQDGKKLSFGFSKMSKKPSLFKPPPKVNTGRKDIEMIASFENREIQTVEKKAVVEKQPLVIPMVQSKKQPANTDAPQDNRPDSELTEDELAARELIRDLTRNQNDPAKGPSRIIDLEQAKAETGANESTVDDYESVPINEFGMAMLRGMSWKEGDGIGLSNKSSSADMKQPVMRVNRMGLGVDKSMLQKTTAAAAQTASSQEKDLVVKKGSYAKVIAGKHEGGYCEVQGFDDDPGRVLVTLTLKGTVVSLPETFIQVVKKEEFDKFSRILNNVKYEQYKAAIDEGGVVDLSKIKKEEKDGSSASGRRDRSDDEDKDYVKRKHSKKKSKSRRHTSDSEEDNRHRRHRSRSRDRHEKHSRRKRSRDRRSRS